MYKISGLVLTGLTVAKVFAAPASAAIGAANDHPSRVKPPPAKNQPLQKSFKVADIGGYFEHANPNDPTNKTIRDIDNDFSSILGDMFSARDQLPGNFENDIYSFYTDEMRKLSDRPSNGWPDIPPIRGRIDLCKSIAVQEFYEDFQKKLLDFASRSGIGGFDQTFTDNLNRKIQELKSLNDAEKKRLEENQHLNPNEKPITCEAAIASNSNGFSIPKVA